MDPKRHEQIKQVFLAACEADPDQVPAVLDQACSGDVELRQEVESLLQHHFAETIIPGQMEETPPEVERFPPGSVLAGRYRILGPLGRGGMGEVYRADDLKLAQAVALKFLSPQRTADPAWLRRYENEVRLAREVTHPNVLRVHDIVETQGEVFISMEYVDGEDLCSLLRRIGRLPGDKAVEVARQMCSGLGAAHDRGVLHRDLKPSNIMIDGQGRVRIADFGIAALAARDQPGGPVPGTPAYMAPELFEGRGPSIQSDLYALGMVLYEAVTGKEPFEGKPPTAPDRVAEPARPSALVPYVESALEAVILRCLDTDPKQRPESAHAVAAMLPGGDPLRAALAAGETPSPSMVAAAGAGQSLSLRAALGFLAAGLLALLLVVALADRTFFLPQAGLAKSPDVLRDRAEQILQDLGYDAAGRESSQGFAINAEYLRHAEQARHAAYFWYRAGNEQPRLPALLGEPPATEDWPAHPGSVDLRLSGEGRLLALAVTPERLRLTGDQHEPVDWAKVFALAGVNFEAFRSVPPVRPPPVYAGRVMAWEGRLEQSNLPCSIAAASLDGRVVFFQVSLMSGDAGSRPVADAGHPAWRIPVPRLVLNLLAIVLAGSLAWYNLHTGRGDHRGARRVALFILLLGLADWLLGERHSPQATGELAALYAWIARAILTAAIAWLCYFAMEPYVRKFWPQVMITWSRVLKGKLHDPLVGRDILIGGTCGILLLLVLQLDNLLPGWLGWPRPLPRLPGAASDISTMVGLRYKLSVLTALVIGSTTLGLVLLLLMLIVRVVVRRGWLAAAISWLGLTAIQALTAGPDTALPWVTCGIVTLAAMLLMARVGLVAIIAAAFFVGLLTSSPLTANFDAWYGPSSVLAIVVTLTLLVYGFVAARAGGPSVWRRLLD